MLFFQLHASLKVVAIQTGFTDKVSGKIKMFLV